MWFGTVALHGASPVRFRVNVCVHQICSYLSIGYSRIKLYSSLFVTVLFGVWLTGHSHLDDIQRRCRRRLWRHQQTLTINTAEERKSQKEPKQRKPDWRQTHKPRRTRLSYVVYQWPSPPQLHCWRHSAMFVCKLLQWHNGHESGRSQPTCHDDIILKVQLTFYGVALLSKLSDHYCQNYVYAGHKS